VVACHDMTQRRPSERHSGDGVLLTALTVGRVAGETAHQVDVGLDGVKCAKEEE
jgi:hypothetical protein